MTTPLTLAPLVGLPYQVVKARLLTLSTGAWILDVELSADAISQQGMPSGKCTCIIGGAPFVGTIDAASSGQFGPTGFVRVVAGGNGWSKSAPAQDWHADNGVLSTIVYEATALAVGETLVDLSPSILGVDVVYNGNDPAVAVFGDAAWFVDPTGMTFVGPRPPAIADPTLSIRDWDPIRQTVHFSCEAPLFPNTTLIDTRFKAPLTVWNVEQIFDGDGSHGWAWTGAADTPFIIEELKAATLQWTRASFLRVYRYRLVVYLGTGPGGGPPRMALQAVTPSSGVPNIVPIAPWSGVAGVVSELAPSQEVLVTFENADPTLPRVVGYSLVSPTGLGVGLPLTTSMDAQTELDVGPTCPVVKVGGGTDFVVQETPYNALLAALTTFAAALASGASSPPLTPVGTAGTALQTALGALPPPATVKTKVG